jgi:hypothetical protein
MQTSSKRRFNYFTMTELVVTLLVISIIMAITVTAPQILGNTKIANSSKKIWKQVHLCREYAVAKHMYIALIFPDELTEIGGAPATFQTNFPLLVNGGMRACKVDRFNNFVEFVDNTEWVMIHDTAEIVLPPTSESTMETIDGVIINNGGTDYTCNKIRAIIFKPTGSTTIASDIGYSNTPIAVVEEEDTGKHLRAEVSIKWLTGKPYYEK